MSANAHAKAQSLILKDWVEGVPAEERAWLDAHLAGCVECARLAGTTSEAVRSLRSASVTLPPGLADRTKLRVYLRAREGRPSDARWLWIGCGASWAMGLASAPLVWRGLEWIGHAARLPDLVWRMGFAFWWTLPALITAGILLIRQASAREESGRG
jgi:hypothetical protein